MPVLSPACAPLVSPGAEICATLTFISLTSACGVDFIKQIGGGAVGGRQNARSDSRSACHKSLFVLEPQGFRPPRFVRCRWVARLPVLPWCHQLSISCGDVRVDVWHLCLGDGLSAWMGTEVGGVCLEDTHCKPTSRMRASTGTARRDS